MTTCIAIGIGGTGSKCLEALIHTCAAGLGPDRVNLAVVDQDRANGNVARVTRVLGLYRGLHHDLRGTDSNLARSRLFATAVDASDEPVWSPLPAKNVTLEGHFNHAALRDPARLLFNALFEEQRERLQPLDEGFRGRPAVGAAAMYSAVAAAAENPGFWADLFTELHDAGETEVRICVFASIFGGTGAAGFPTIARMIRDKAKRYKCKLTVSGVLLLPYFVFPDPAESDDRNQIRARGFLHTTQQALLYYNDLVTKVDRDLFNHLYVVGAERPFILPNLGPGANTQTNPALLPELLGALAAVRFFRYGARGETPTLLMRAGRRVNGQTNDSEVTWDDIPTVERGGNVHDVRSNLASLVRFAVAYLSVYQDCLRPDVSPPIARQTWFHNLIAKPGVRLADERVQRTLAALGSYCEAILQWSFELSRRRDAADLRINLFQFDDLITNADAGGIKLNGSTAGFDRVVPSQRPRDLADVFYSISAETRETNAHGLGAFLAQLFRGCRLETEMRA